MFKVKNADANYSLEQLGNRICIIGCTASGKSTLANRLSKKLVVPVIHLDFLAHYEHTNWQRKSEHEIVVAQQQVMQKPAWVIDGNYSICMPERFANATAIIWLDVNVLKAAYRYIKRSIFKNERIGKLPGSKKEFRFSLLKHIIFNYPKNRNKYDKLLQKINLPIVRTYSLTELQKLYTNWGLSVV